MSIDLIYFSVNGFKTTYKLTKLLTLESTVFN